MAYDDHQLDEGPSEADLERFSEGQTRRCPECNKDVLDETELCPICGYAFTSADALLRPWHAVLAVGLILLIIAFFVL